LWNNFFTSFHINFAGYGKFEPISEADGSALPVADHINGRLPVLYHVL
jgi:hypothetical protein